MSSLPIRHRKVPLLLVEGAVILLPFKSVGVYSLTIYIACQMMGISFEQLTVDVPDIVVAIKAKHLIISS